MLLPLTSSDLTKNIQEQTIYVDISVQRELFNAGIISRITYQNGGGLNNSNILTSSTAGGVAINDPKSPPITTTTQASINATITQLKARYSKVVAVAAVVLPTWVNGGVVTTLAGSGAGIPSNGAFADGTGVAASFNIPTGVAVLPDGNTVVADQNNNRIRLVTPLGVVTTLAGSASAAFADGTGAAASFNGPSGVAVLSDGNIVVADTNNHCIRVITYPGGVVTTLAGSGSPGFADGTGAGASFNFPFGVAVITSSGVIVVSDSSNHRIRLVTYPGAVVTTLAGSGGTTFANGTGVGATFYIPRGIAVLSDGNIVVADYGNNRIRLITYPGAVVTTLAGNSAYSPFADGTGAAATFFQPHGVAVIPSTYQNSGNIVVADYQNNRIRLITYPGAVVTTLAGNTAHGSTNGTGAAATFRSPQGITVNSSTGAIVVADTSNHLIRLIT